MTKASKYTMEVMDGRKIAAEVRLQQWMQIVQARQESGQTIKEFCEVNGLNEKTFHYWKRKLRKAACMELAVQETQEIVEVTALVDGADCKPPVGGITVHIGGAEVKIQGDASPEVVECVLRALKC